MMRILYVITELDIGGAEKCLYNLVTRLDRTSFVPIVACLRGHGKIGSWLEKAGINVFYFDMKKWGSISVTLKLRRILREMKIDILHTFLFHANIIGRISAGLAKIGRWNSHKPFVICSVRVAEKRRHHLWFDRWTHWLVDIETCVSQSVREFTIKAGIPSEKLVVIPNGVNLDRFKPLPIRVAKSQLGIGKDVILILSIGRLEEQKGMRFLVEAAKILTPEISNLQFAIVGHGGLDRTLKQQAEQAGLSGRIMFLGWRDDIPLILSACDVFVLPSLWEGMPNVILEAMACAKPIISTRVDGCSDLIMDGETGYLVPPGDPKSLAQAIKYVVTNPIDAARTGLAGHKRAKEHFSVDKMVSLNEDLYNKISGLGST